ncbi:DUF881 domain-containing protein [Brevibacterium litoralis]|uniref:DUF881 domain-containing protein n=1 Tax=Brevibacterium litoralis TaxID=3138935 RepID=UPI0032EE1070
MSESRPTRATRASRGRRWVERARAVAERRVISREYDRRPRQSFSESLLADLWQRTPEPDYELVKARNLPRGTTSRIVFALIAVVLGFALAVAVVQLTRVQAGGGPEAALAQRIHDGQAANTQLAEDNETRSLAVDEAREGFVGDELEEALTGLETAASVDEVTGDLTVVTLADQKVGPEGAQSAAEANKVQDIDLRTVVNGLFVAGATAVDVNGHRMTSTSSIRAAGGAILVNYDPIAPPFTVRALGGEDLTERFEVGASARYLGLLADEYGITSTLTRTEGTLPAAEVTTPRYAVPADDAEVLPTGLLPAPSAEPSAPAAAPTERSRP